MLSRQKPTLNYRAMDADKTKIRQNKSLVSFAIRVLLTSFFISSCFFSFSQDLNRVISIQIKDKPLALVIDTIGQMAEIHFSYNPQNIAVDKKISIRAANKPVKEILDELFKKKGIVYMIVENQVVLKPVKSSPELPVNEKKAENKSKTRHCISGFIKDKSTGEALIGAIIYIQGSSTGAFTNTYGYYSLTIPEGNYTLAISFMGYIPFIQNIELNKDLFVSAELSENKFSMNEIEVTADGNSSEIQNNSLSQIRLSPEILSGLPGFVGEVDVIKSLQLIPGIQSFGDGSALYFVRGGNSDQNLFLIDEVPVYNPSHLFGFVSAISPEAINDVQIYKGDFPARYGGRLSSVIDISTKNGNLKKPGFSGNISPYSTSLSIEGPIIKDRCSFFLSGRLSTLYWMKLFKAPLKSFDISYYDINAKLNLKANDKNRLYLTFYTGNDIFNRINTSSIHTFGISWNNMVTALRWNHIFNNKLFSNTTLYYSQYNYYLYISKEQNDYWNSSIANMALKDDFSWFINPNNTVRSGIEVSLQFSNPGNVSISDNEVQRNAPVIPRYKSLEYAVYLSNEQKIGKHVLLSYGFRLPVWQNIGPTTVYNFNSGYHVFDTTNIAKNSIYSTLYSIEPRVNIQYLPGKNSVIKASYCNTTQFVQILSNSTSPFTSLDVWVPAGPNIKPQKANQFTLGYFGKLFSSKLGFSAEGFYKHYYNHIDYKDNANMLYNPLIEGELRFGKAWSYGVELMLHKEKGKFTGWLAYTYSRSFSQTEGVNNNLVYPVYYDRPHNFCLNLSYNTNKHWAFSATWIFLSGSAITTPVGFYSYNGYQVPVYGSKNNDRLPPYHRLDISVTCRLNKPGKRFSHSLVLTIYNVYARLNPFSVNFNKFDNNGSFVIPSDLNGKNELVPTVISVAGIIPSINYQIRF